MMKQHRMKKNYKEILIDSDDDFELYILQPVYRELSCSSNAFFKNIKTGENCGSRIFLCAYKYNNDGSIKEKIELEENCYEIVEKV